MEPGLELQLHHQLEPEPEPEPEPEAAVDDGLTPRTRLRHFSSHVAPPISSPGLLRPQTDLAHPHQIENGRMIDENVTLRPRTARRRGAQSTMIRC
eukprot:COSAG02_NODE_17577_length_994_cov_0.706145_2_plen_95_part_01